MLMWFGSVIIKRMFDKLAKGKVQLEQNIHVIHALIFLTVQVSVRLTRMGSILNYIHYILLDHRPRVPACFLFSSKVCTC